jgi:hypothetical protein
MGNINMFRKGLVKFLLLENGLVINRTVRVQKVRTGWV